MLSPIESSNPSLHDRCEFRGEFFDIRMARGIALGLSDCYSRLDGLLVGVCAAPTKSFLPQRWRQLTQHPYLLLAAGLVLIAAAYVTCVERTLFVSSVFSFPSISLGYGLVLVAAVSPESFLHRIGLRLTAFLAAVSYSLY